MLIQKDLQDDFDNKTDRVLFRRMDKNCYNIQLTYIPFRNETDYVNDLENIDITIQFMLFYEGDFDGEKYSYINVIRSSGDLLFTIQTMKITLTRVFPDKVVKYVDIFPPRIEKKTTTNKNIEKLKYKVQSFDSLYPS